MRDGEKGPVAIEMVTRRVQTRRNANGPAPKSGWSSPSSLADERAVGPRASRDTDHDAHYRYQYYLTPTHGAAVTCKRALC